MSAFDYPFSVMKEDYTAYPVADMWKGFVDEEPADPGNFPDNIAEVYWIQEGYNDGDDWKCLCKLTNAYYVYYTASCDYTGFDCQGDMRLQITKNPVKLFDFLKEHEREAIVTSKSAAQGDLKPKN